MSTRPLIAHVLYRLDVGGMERVLVTLINHTCHRYRHAVVCLEGIGDIRSLIEPDDVPCLALSKKPGKDWGCYVRLWRALRGLKPDLVHTYNVGALDAAPVARLAGTRCVIHAERGRDASDPHGESRKYRLMRRWLLPFIDRYVAVSRDLATWLTDSVGIPPSRVVCVPNGIDVEAFAPATGVHGDRRLLGDFAPRGTLVIGTVGRLDRVKDHASLISAFGQMCDRFPQERARLRLVLVGEGAQRSVLAEQVEGMGLAGQMRLLGRRDDVAALLAEFDLFVLCSIAEGMPGAVLEAMAAGLPVVATAVGGVPEVVQAGVTGTLVPSGDPAMLAEAIGSYVTDETLRRRHGAAGRERVMREFGLPTMLAAYVKLYDGLLAGAPRQPSGVAPVSGTSGRRES